MKEDKPLYRIDDEDEDETPLYQFEDEDADMNPETGGQEPLGEENLAYAYGRNPDGIETNHDDKGGNKKGSNNPWVLLLDVMFSPMNGWRNLKRSKIGEQRMGKELFYPLCGVAAAMQFLRLIYEANLQIETVIVRALIVFMSLFLSNFIIPVLARPLMSGKGKTAIVSEFGKSVVMTLLSTIAIFDILPLLLPPLDPVFFFMPLWTIYLITRLPKFLGIEKDKNAMTVTVLSLLVVGMPILWTIILEWMLTGSTSIVI